MKKRKSCFIWLLCILLLVTALPAVDFTDVQAASVSSTFTGWKTYGGKKYYYKNGKKLTDLHKIGKYYYCFATDGAMLTGAVPVSISQQPVVTMDGIRVVKA